MSESSTEPSDAAESPPPPSPDGSSTNVVPPHPVQLAITIPAQSARTFMHAAIATVVPTDDTENLGEYS
jgi:hypothetical protein